VYLSPDYDAADRSPLNETEVAMNVDTVENVAWRSIVLPMENQRLNRAYKAHYNMTDTRFDTTQQDQKTIDPAFIVLAAQVDGFTSIGKLWVEYDVELTEPQKTTDFDNQGGAGTLKNTGLNPNVVNVFANSALAVDNQEITPILKTLNGTAFPGPNLFEFTRDWEGFITKNVVGTGISAMGSTNKNNVAVADTSIPATINGAQTSATYQVFDRFKAGDILGSSPISATTLSSIIYNLGGSAVD